MEATPDRIRESNESPSGESGDLVLDVGDDSGRGGVVRGAGIESCAEIDKMCRICHGSCNFSTESSDYIQLGCGCKYDLAIAHRCCAERWFTTRGNRYCEICGVFAKNVPRIKDSVLAIKVNSEPARDSFCDRFAARIYKPVLGCIGALVFLALTMYWFFISRSSRVP